VTIDFTRRQCCAQLATVLGGLALGACATMSPQEERQAGRREAEEVERTIGLVQEPGLVQYVEAIGARLARASGRPDIAWTWAVADEPDPNAFALPGGWIYVTRGLLALTNREDELAGVLAHEMAHVIERHAARRVAAATPLAVLFGVPSGILGILSPSLGGIVGDAGRAVSGLTLAPYSRDQELEADRVGVALAARAGWDPRALTEMIATLERAAALAGASTRSSFFATHPATPQRVANIESLLGSVSVASAAPIASGRTGLLSRLDGLVVGSSAAHGVFAGRLFLHADLDIALETPADWTAANGPEAAGALSPDETALVVLQVVGPGDDPVAGARADGLAETHVKTLRRVRISGLPAAALTASTRGGAQVALTWIAHRARILRVATVCRREDGPRYGAELERATLSVRPLRAEDHARITESRLRIRPARAGERIGQVLARGGAAWSAAQAAVANGVAPERPLERDWPVKVAVVERYQPSPGRKP